VDLLIAGLNRSGTSALSHLLARRSASTLLDDPEWAITGGSGPRTYQQNADARRDLAGHRIVKCPRMCEVIDDLLSDFADVRVVLTLRDPRDVWASVTEKVILGRPTRMLSNERFGKFITPLDGFILQAQHYYRNMLHAAQSQPERVLIVSYETFTINKSYIVDTIGYWAHLPLVRALEEDEFNHQFGPAEHKRNPNEIRGAGRWTTDISTSDANRLIADLGNLYTHTRQVAFSTWPSRS
jgi:Sulfotransferase family